ncbi:hypothetical protein MKX03_022407, partial [Papaver bracteatum]
MEEAVKRIKEASEHQNKASDLLGFSIKLKEPERKKIKYNRKVPVIIEEMVKKSKGCEASNASVIHEGE